MEFPFSVPRLCINVVRLPVANNTFGLLKKKGKIIAGLPVGHSSSLVLIGKLLDLK